MNNNYVKVYNDIISSLTKKKSEMIVNVEKAFLFAEKKHEGQFRKGGDPYILHPLCVAQILEQLDFNTDVIASAILHDTVEDCGVTIEEISQNFNPQIAQIVDGVTAITKDEFKADSDDIYTNTTEFLKLAIDDKTFQKLISIGKNNKFAFYIKFADRLNNLESLFVFPRHKQIAKIEETQKWVIPLAKLLKTRFFTRKLENFCFVVKHLETIGEFIKFYNRYFEITKEEVEQNKDFLFQAINSHLRSIKAKFTLSEIIIEPKTEMEIFENIKSYYDINKFNKIKESNFNFIPTYNMYFVFNKNINKATLKNIMFDIINELKLKNLFSFFGVKYDEFKNEFLSIRNNTSLIFDTIALSYSDYTQITNGTTEGTDIDIIDDNTSGEIPTNFITVYTRSGEPIRLSYGSTILDFAFKIHKDIGFACKYAHLNNLQTKIPIYTKLKAEDKVEIICERDENNLLKNIAELKWIAYANNESTQRRLIKYFEKKYQEK